MNSMAEKIVVFPDPHAARERGAVAREGGARPPLPSRKSEIAFDDAVSEVMERTAMVREYLAR